jgi:hypothetical protein
MSTLVVEGTEMAGLARAKAKGIKLGRGNKKDGERRTALRHEQG